MVVADLKSVSRWIVLGLLLVLSVSSRAALNDGEVFLQEMTSAKLKAMPELVDQLIEVGGSESLPVLVALLEGDLFYIKESNVVVVATPTEKGSKVFNLVDVLTNESLEPINKKAIKKIRTNNKLRSKLRTEIARLSLSADDNKVRQEAVLQMMKKMDRNSLALLQEVKPTEKSEKVIEAMNVAIAVGLLDFGEENEKIEAINQLEGNLEPVVKNKLTALMENSESQVIKRSAQDALASIESKIKFFGYIETLFFGLSLGSVLLLVAAGLAITFGVMGVINMAHGEMIMLGAYTTYVVQLLMPNHIEYSLFVAIPAAFIVSGFFGILIERGVIQFLKGRPLETLLATFGISLVLQQLVRTVFSPLNREVITPQFMSGALEINSVFSITYNRLYILVFALIVFFMLQLILKKTSLGLNVRAVSQNRDMAKAMGIRTEWVDALTFGLGSGIAGLAGVALSQITNVGPNLGQAYIIDSFMVVVFGGVGNLWGTLVGGFSLGVLNKFLEPVTGAVLANIIVLVGIILFIQKRPRGLFPQKGRAAE